jgi:hypothetical protein
MSHLIAFAYSSVVLLHGLLCTVFLGGELNGLVEIWGTAKKAEPNILCMVPKKYIYDCIIRAALQYEETKLEVYFSTQEGRSSWLRWTLSSFLMVRKPSNISC